MGLALELALGVKVTVRGMTFSTVGAECGKGGIRQAPPSDTAGPAGAKRKSSLWLSVCQNFFGPHGVVIQHFFFLFISSGRQAVCMASVWDHSELGFSYASLFLWAGRTLGFESGLGLRSGNACKPGSTDETSPYVENMLCV